MLSILLGGALWGLFIAGALIVIKLAIMTLEWVIERAKSRIKSNNETKMLIADTKDLLKEKMGSADKRTLDDLTKMSQECPMVTGFYNAETDDIEDLSVVQTQKVDARLYNGVKNSKDGMIVIGA